MSNAAPEPLPAVDREGHLRNRFDWTPEVAVWLAESSGIALEETHWEIIRLVRDFHQRTDVSPAMRPLVKLVRDRLGPAIGNSIRLHELFPGSPARLVTKIAGLPRPKNCL